MGNDKAPFEVGDKVVCLKSSGVSMGCQAIKGNIYTVAGLWQCPKCGDKKILIKELVPNCHPTDSCCVAYSMKSSGIYCMGSYRYFAPVNPYSNSVSKELAEKAMNIGDGADQPIKIKEPVLN